MPELHSPGRLDPAIFAHHADHGFAGLLLPAAVMTGLFGALILLVS